MSVRRTGVILVFAMWCISACRSREETTATKSGPSSTAPIAPTAPPEPPHVVTQLAPNQANASSLLIDGGHLYWSTEDLDAGIGRVMRMPIEGGPTEVVVDKQKGLVAFRPADGSLFWIVDDDGRSEIRTKPVKEGATKRLALRGPGATAIYASGGAVYWTEFGSAFRLATNATQPTPLYERKRGPGGMSTALIVDGPDVFWSLDDALLTAHVDGSGFRELAKGFAQVRGLAADAKAVYVADAGARTTGAVFRVDRSTGEKWAILPRAARPWSVFATSKHVFVMSMVLKSDAARGTVMRIAPDGSNPFVLASNVTYGTAVAANDTHVFWTSAEPGAVWRTTR